MTSVEQKDIYSSIVINKTVPVNIINVGKNIKNTLEKIIASDIEGKCCNEGFIKENSVKVQTYSSGLISGDNVHFEAVFLCDTCNPVEGMTINCVAKNITKAGIRAEIDGDSSPLIIFIARDHQNIDDYYNSIKENDNISVRVIGQRYELNDKYISIIAELIQPVRKPESLKIKIKTKNKTKTKIKPKINIDKE